MREGFRDRRDAGHALAARLGSWRGRDDVVVLALPRGGVPVGAVVARDLDVPLDVFLVRKLGVPGHGELAMGAIASGGVRVLNDAVLDSVRLPAAAIDEVTTREQRELERRERAYRDDRPPPDVADAIVILVDDGLATGSTMQAAIEALRRQGPRRIVAAVPVGAPSTCREIAGLADEAICLLTPQNFFAVGQWYADFSEVTDDDVRALLASSRRQETDESGRTATG